MDFEKIKTDFEKRYDRPCEKIYFAGMGIELFSEKADSVSGCLSLGEAMATARRDDGRITVQFSGSDAETSFNADEIDEHLGERVARILKKATETGVEIGGADIFIFKNTRITDLLEPLILGGITAFCQKVPKMETFLPRFENYQENIITLSGRKGCVTVLDGQRKNYIPFLGGKCKIVIIYTDKAVPYAKKTAGESFADGVLAIKKGDMERFGALLDKNTERFLTGNKCDSVKALVTAVKTVKDATGCGILPAGGVFSVVENHKVDRFIHGVSAVYQKSFGGVPDFYVTDFVDSGYFVN